MNYHKLTKPSGSLDIHFIGPRPEGQRHRDSEERGVPRLGADQPAEDLLPALPYRRNRAHGFQVGRSVSTRYRRSRPWKMCERLLEWRPVYCATLLKGSRHFLAPVRPHWLIRAIISMQLLWLRRLLAITRISALQSDKGSSYHVCRGSLSKGTTQKI